MIVDLRPYPEYKDSGLLWLGKMPAHWDVRRAKFLLRCIDVRSTTGEEELLTVSAERGVVPRNSMKVTMFKAESYVGHKLCWPGDLAINSLWAWGRGLGVTKHHGIISSAYGVYRLRERFKQYGDFIHHLVRSTPFHWELRVRSKGVWISRLQLTDDAFLDAPIPLPSPPEAEAIVRFIATMERRISRFIRNRRRLIEVLNEQKQAIINRAVTRGLDPNAPLKPSGIDWLSDIPEHWEVRKLRAILKPTTERNRSDLPLLSVVREKGVIIRNVDDQEENRNFIPDDLSNYRVVHVGQFAMNKMKAWQGSYGVSKHEGIVSPAYFVFDLIGNLYDRFFSFALRSRAYVPFFAQASDGVRTGQWDLAIPRMKEIPFLLPPLDEQERIAEEVPRQTLAIEQAIAHAQREIDLIREYRTRLIADVVTGKVDVRGQAKAVQPRKANVHFYRSVLAAEIVEQHQGTPKFGWIKLQKAMILAERHLRLKEIQSRPQRAAAGPFDNPMMRSIHAQLERQKWFKPVKMDKGTRYEPMENRGGHRKYFDRYWGDRREQFDRLMALIKPMKTEQSEIVATLYMAWNDFLIHGEAVDDDRLVTEVLNNWDESKRRISEDRWRTAIAWMRKKGFVPQGFGAATTDSGANGGMVDGDD